MKLNYLSSGSAILCGVFLVAGCGRQTRGSADADGPSRAATPAEGGAVSTAGSAGQAKNFGDTSRSGAHSGVTPPERPKQNNTPESNEPTQQPQQTTK